MGIVIDLKKHVESRGWTPGEMNTLHALAVRMRVQADFGITEAGHPWCTLESDEFSYSVVREGDIAVLDHHGRVVVTAPTLGSAVSRFQETWWASQRRTG